MPEFLSHPFDNMATVGFWPLLALLAGMLLPLRKTAPAGSLEASQEKWHVLTWKKGALASPEEWHETFASASGAILSRLIHGWGLPTSWVRKVDPEARPRVARDLGLRRLLFLVAAVVLVAKVASLLAKS